VQLDETHAVLLGPGEGESLPAAKRELHVKYEGDELEVLELVCDAGYGPVDPHVHDAHTDSFFILEGEVEFTIGDETVRAGPGTWVAAPPGVRHGFSIPGPDRARMLNVQAPGAGFIGRVRNA
jgi:mannose-6-phosphate isomerase-like protein (cupin superfamily)